MACEKGRNVVFSKGPAHIQMDGENGMKSRNKLGFIMSFSAVVSGLYCYVENNNSMYNYLFLIPLVYALNMFWFTAELTRKKDYGVTFVFYVSQALIFIRYVVTPFSIVYSASFTSWGYGPDPSDKDMLIAEILMCLEICFVFLTQYLAIAKFCQKRYITKIQSRRSFEESKPERIGVLCAYAVFACVLVLYFQPERLIMDQYFSYSSGKATSKVAMEGVIEILAETFKKVFIILALIMCKRGYDKYKNQFFRVLAVLAILVNMMMNSGSTRIHMIFALLISLYFMNILFGKIPKAAYVICGGVCIFAVLNVSIVKFLYAIGDNKNPIRVVMTIFMGQFQDYFAGPRLVGQMLNVSKVYGDSIGIGTFINDFTGSIPFVSNYVDQTNRINYYFCRYCGVENQSLIAPMLGIGYSYCYAFPFFLTMLFEYFVISLDYKMAVTDRITYKYLFGYMGFICAMCMGYNTQIIYACFENTFIPLLILFVINDVVRVKWKVH